MFAELWTRVVDVLPGRGAGVGAPPVAAWQGDELPGGPSAAEGANTVDWQGDSPTFAGQPASDDPYRKLDAFFPGDPFDSRPLAINPLLQAYCRLDRADVALNGGQRAALREEMLTRLPPDIARDATARYADAEIVFLTGILGLFPRNAYFNLASSVFGHGGLVLGTAFQDNRCGSRGLFDYYGGDSRALQRDWRAEVPVAITRFAQALRQSQGRALVKERVVVAHSKGYKIARALKSMRDEYDYSKDDGTVSKRFYPIFPGLDRVARADMAWAMKGLRTAKFVSLGGPVEGIGDGFLENSLIGAINERLLRDIGTSFAPDLVAAYHEVLGAGPDDMDLLITSQVRQESPPSVLTPGVRHGFFGTVIHQATKGLFDGAGHLFHAGLSDGLVAPYSLSYRNHRVLRNPHNHLEQVERPSAAVDMLSTLLDHGI